MQYLIFLYYKSYNPLLLQPPPPPAIYPYSKHAARCWAQIIMVEISKLIGQAIAKLLMVVGQPTQQRLNKLIDAYKHAFEETYVSFTHSQTQNKQTTTDTVRT